MDFTITHNVASCRFEANIDGHTAYIEYKMRPGVITVLHTIVPKELEGRGIAAIMTKHVLEYISQEKLELVPLCPYLLAYLKKHPDYQSLVKK